jgi:hypothetical protein
MSTPSGPKKRRERGDDGISWDKINKCYIGTISLGHNGTASVSGAPSAARPRSHSSSELPSDAVSESQGGECDKNGTDDSQSDLEGLAIVG